MLLEVVPQREEGKMASIGAQYKAKPLPIKVKKLLKKMDRPHSWRCAVSTSSKCECHCHGALHGSSVRG